MRQNYSNTDWLARSIPLAAIMLLAMLLTACSFKSVYNRLDFVIAEYVEGLVTLDDVLESDLENRTELLLDWHRTTQLKQYAEWFREIQADANPALNEERLKYHEHKLETYWLNISSRLNEDMAEFLPRLSQAALFGVPATSSHSTASTLLRLPRTQRRVRLRAHSPTLGPVLDMTQSAWRCAEETHAVQEEQ